MAQNDENQELPGKARREKRLAEEVELLIADLPERRLLEVRQTIRERLRGATSQDGVEVQIDKQAAAQVALNQVSEHLGLDADGKRSLRLSDYNATAEELGLDMSGAQIVKAWGSWRDARLVLAGDSLPFNMYARQRKRQLERRRQKVEEHNQALRDWLATNPAMHTAHSYSIWASAQNHNRGPSQRPYPVVSTIQQYAKKSWQECVEAATEDQELVFKSSAPIPRGPYEEDQSPLAQSDEGRLINAATVSRRLHALRKARGLTQDEVAQAARCGQPDVSKAERPSHDGFIPKVALPIAVALGCSLDLLITGTTEEFADEFERLRQATLTTRQGDES